MASGELHNLMWWIRGGLNYGRAYFLFEKVTFLLVFPANYFSDTNAMNFP